MFCCLVFQRNASSGPVREGAALPPLLPPNPRSRADTLNLLANADESTALPNSAHIDPVAFRHRARRVAYADMGRNRVERCIARERARGVGECRDERPERHHGDALEAAHGRAAPPDRCS